MKKQLILIVTLIVTTLTFAQNPLNKGQFQLNGGLGFSGWGIPIYAGIDYGIHKDISIGAEISYRSYNENYYYSNNNYKYKNTAFAFGTNGNYHFNSLIGIPKKFDFYAGANVTYFAWSSEYYHSNNNNNNNNHLHNNVKSNVELGIQVGGRYFFNNNFGLNTEISSGAVTGVKFGITYQL